LITGELVHNDILHLLFNELVLYVSCANLEAFLRKKSMLAGSLEMLAIYLASSLLSVLISFIRHRRDFDYSSAGASASIMGCMISFMILAPNFITFYIPVLGAIRNKFTVIFYILVLVVYQKRKKEDFINHEQHFFGAIGGIISTLLLFPGII
jgi:membrane associated rhomboid family serine protease